VHSTLRQTELVIDRTPIGLRNARNDQAPFSLGEFAAACIAMAVVMVVAFQGILGSREANLSRGNLLRPRLTSSAGSSLKVSPWRLDNSADANMQARPYRPSDVVAVRKTESSGPGSAGIIPPARHPVGNGPPASTFFAEGSPTAAVEMVLPDFDGPLIGPPDLFHMKNAIVAQPGPVKDATIPPRLKRTDNR
jgi:hypothetical protein